MKQLQFYKYAAIGLLFLNIAMLVFFFLTKPKHPPMDGLKKDAKAILKMDDAQNEVFLKSVKEHQKKMEAFSQQQKKLLKPYFNNLIDSNEIHEEVLEQVEQLERKKIESIYQHFQEIKSILRADQLSGFKEFMNHATKRILQNPRKKPHPPRENKK